MAKDPYTLKLEKLVIEMDAEIQQLNALVDEYQQHCGDIQKYKDEVGGSSVSREDRH